MAYKLPKTACLFINEEQSNNKTDYINIHSNLNAKILREFFEENITN